MLKKREKDPSCTQLMTNLDLLESIKDKSYPYYFCLLTLPRHQQVALTPLWGIAAEIRFIPLSVINPLAGFLRLTAWRDSLSSAQMTHLIEWLNTYEVYFDERVDLKVQWLSYIQGESILLHQSLLLLAPEASPALEEASKALGEVLGLIYLMQSEHRFRFRNDSPFKKELILSIKSRLEKLKQLKNIPREAHGLFALLGYCKDWLQEYSKTFHPVTLGEPVIQKGILKQRIKFWGEAKLETLKLFFR